jgi:signal transduction histidine kinase
MGRDKIEEASVEPYSQAIEMANELLNQVRDLSLHLRPSMLDDLGLLPTIIWQAEKAQEQLGLEISLSMEGIEERRFPTDLETTVYRVIQESITNVARHAETDHVWISSWLQDDTLFVQIQDEGVGFEVAPVMGVVSTGGLFGMRERARLVNGRLEVDSELGAGTTITLSLPIDGFVERRRSGRRKK